VIASKIVTRQKRLLKMTELLFLVEDDLEGGYSARAFGEAIFTQAEDIKSLREMIRDAVQCHFSDEQQRPKLIRLHIVREEVMAS
jgi:predicted RNase H-like HicB family nuclease